MVSGVLLGAWTVRFGRSVGLSVVRGPGLSGTGSTDMEQDVCHMHVLKRLVCGGLSSVAVRGGSTAHVHRQCRRGGNLFP